MGEIDLLDPISHYIPEYGVNGKRNATIYHLLAHRVFAQQQKNIFKISSMQLRIWNEVATIFLIAIVFLVVVKDALVWTKALAGLAVLILVLLSAIKIYKKVRYRD